MQFSLVICTYMRAESLMKLLHSVNKQTKYPDEILIIDGSTNDETKEQLEAQTINKLIYYKVEPHQRGLTKQRNFGVSKVSPKSEIVCFLDDDTILEEAYFEEILKAFQSNKNVVGVGGVAVNENRWNRKEDGKSYNNKKFYQLDNYVVKEGLRNVIRNYFGLQSPALPGVMPSFSHGRTCGYPLNNKIYPVDLLIGMSFNFKKEVFKHISFSTYFEGYGLYEDADFSLRALQFGQNVINTAAKLNHYHDASGRPNKYKYGKMVARNGWYVWRIKYPKPTLKARLKWNLTFILLMKLRFLNVITTKDRYEAFTEALGRLSGWMSLIVNKPKIES